ncbi:UNVERIFIED_CONTAM: hypothetical protein FKN15_031443 [Acipenser sinensis]
MHDRAAAVPQEATVAADPRETIAGGEPGPAVVLGFALFSAAVTRQFSPLLFLAAYARAAVDCQHLVPVRPVLKGEAAPAPLPRVVVMAETEAAPAALLLVKAAGPPPLLAAKAAGAPLLLAVKAAGPSPLLAAAGKPAGMLPLLVAAMEAEPAGMLPLLVAAMEVEPAGMLPLLVAAMEEEPAGTLPLVVEVGATRSPLTAMEVEPAGTLPLLVEVAFASL